MALFTGYETHHIIPRRYGGEDILDNIEPLTPAEHKQEHIEDVTLFTRIGALKRVLMMDWVDNLVQFQNWHPEAIEMYKVAWLTENYLSYMERIEALESQLPGGMYQ